MFITIGFEILALAITNLIRLVMGEDNLHLMRPITLPISCRYLSGQSTMNSPCLYSNCDLCNEEKWRNNGFNNHKTVMTKTSCLNVIFVRKFASVKVGCVNIQKSSMNEETWSDDGFNNHKNVKARDCISM